MNIRIDGEFYGVAHDMTHDHAYYVSEGRTEFVLFASREEAGKEARSYWQDMAENDPREFRCIVGDETLVQWALGNYAGAGSTKVASLSEWLDLWLDTPEDHFASYDNVERDVEPPTHVERARWGFIMALRETMEREGFRTDGANCKGINLNGTTYWLMEDGHAGTHGTRFSSDPDGSAIEASRDDLEAALEEDGVTQFVEGWDHLVDELGFTPTVAYRRN